MGSPGGSVVKSHLQCRSRRKLGCFPGLGRTPGGGHGNPLQYPCLETPMDRGAWWATPHRIAKSQTQLKQLSTHAHDLFWPMSCEWDWHTVWAGAFHCQFETLFRPFSSATATGIISETACLVS